jgi:DNA-binding response OmpR family regulator
MRRKLLLIEDDAGIAAMLPNALRPLGYDVLLAGDCRMAAEIAASEADEIDVVLCDVMLPDGRGAIAAEAVLRYCPNVWIIFTSGYPIEMLDERGALSLETLSALGASYLPKPFLPRDVHTMIEGRFTTENSRVARAGSVVPEWRRSSAQLSY